ncbi:DUF4037 domain-containing protein [Bacillus sp. FJAT-42376]|uniref:DUF4037 domain-containing protein n=1 Tax=Bacillus sp. FJAT-42376 TaxID=2014076 RepID=UPI000F4DF5C8|nr:DUF4037 domain-containing protein [Bacillus sp. FJAT-42376]AZB41881.1 DUF4037 domain-containing protein [Bacillus sp. FJAT-42376]
MEPAKIAENMARVYRQNPKVESVWIGGSVSRGWNDGFSDIELFLVWKSEPADADRMEPIQAVQGEILDYHAYEDEEWSESYMAFGVKMELSHFLTATVEKVIREVTVNHSANLDHQCLASSISSGICLEGEEVFSKLKNGLTPYPAGLKKAMMEENLDFGNRWRNRQALADRQDWLMLHEVFVTVQKKVMAILFALNESYVHHPAFKWQRKSLDEMAVKPADAAERLEQVFLEHPSYGLAILEEFLDEFFGIVRMHHPVLSFDQKLESSMAVRPQKKTGE